MDVSRDRATVDNVSGTWTMTDQQLLGVRIGRVARGDPGAVGKRLGLGRVESIDERQMVLQGG